MSAEIVEAEVLVIDVHGDPETVLADIYRQNAMIIEQNKRIAEALDGILKVASDVKDEVGPLLSKLENNPMFKMFLGKSK
ncbi:MAG TPA: hypothetical protein VIY48_02505 [Candidatus Paceibacterota bacterium]